MLGYCCINQTLRNLKPSVYSSRSLIKRTFNLLEASNRALQNCKDLLTILKWNERHNIKVFRISSDLFPRYTCPQCKYNFTDLPHHQEILEILSSCGKFANEHRHLLSFHPGQYNILCSNKPHVVKNTIEELEYHSFISDLIDPFNKLQIDINIHVGATYGGDYENTANRFNEEYNKLSENLKKRLTLENDDKSSPGGWSVTKIYELIHNRNNIPIVWDIHHSSFSRENNIELEEEYELAKNTWKDKIMMIHYSESEDEIMLSRKHSYLFKNKIPEFVFSNNKCRIELECKGKEEGVFQMKGLLSK